MVHLDRTDPTINKSNASARFREDALKEIVSKMYLQGFSQWEIAREVEKSLTTVHTLLAQVREEWKQSYLSDFNLAKNRELDRIDLLERTYWRAWMSSGGSFIENEIDEIGATLRDLLQGGVGDARYLQGVQWCISERARIIGLYAPTRQEHTGADGSPLSTMPQVFVMLPDNGRNDSTAPTKGPTNDVSG